MCEFKNKPESVTRGGKFGNLVCFQFIFVMKCEKNVTKSLFL